MTKNQKIKKTWNPTYKTAICIKLYLIFKHKKKKINSKLQLMNWKGTNS